MMLKCWGLNDFGQLGDGTTLNRKLPTAIDLRPSTNNNTNTEPDLNESNPSSFSPLKIALGVGWHTCALTTEKVLKCWGSNNVGQLGDGTTTNRHTPTGVVNLGQDSYAEEIAVGRFTSCVLTNHNMLKCWGLNDYGQLGDGTTVNRMVPTEVNFGLGLNSNSNLFAKQISLGGRHSCAITSDNMLKCWGYNGSGWIGDGTFTHRTTPTTIDLLDGSNGSNDSPLPEQVVLGFSQTCVVMDNNVLKCWGMNDDGQLGDGSTIDRTLPTDIDALSQTKKSSPQQIAIGVKHTCAITYNDQLKCWGSNWHGQLGDGTTNGRISPTLIHG